MPKKKIVLLDGNSLLHRSFHGVRPLHTTNGTQINAVFGFGSMMLSILSFENPDYFMAAFDTKVPTFRKEKCATYKAGRTHPGNEFYSQVPIVYDMLARFGMKRLECDGFEADDILATVASIAHKKGIEVILVTSDRDALQLVNDHVTVHDLNGGYVKARVYDEQEVEKKFGVRPDQIVDYKALMGDSSDNLPGVRGIGPKGAANLIQKYETLEKIYENLSELKEKEMERLANDKQNAFFTQEMAQLRYDVPIDINLQEHLLSAFDGEGLVSFFDKYELYSLKGRFLKWINKSSHPDLPDMPEIADEEKKSKKKEKHENQLSLF